VCVPRTPLGTTILYKMYLIVTRIDLVQSDVRYLPANTVLTPGPYLASDIAFRTLLYYIHTE
jgi:hypothetical protein